MKGKKKLLRVTQDNEGMITKTHREKKKNVCVFLYTCQENWALTYTKKKKRIIPTIKKKKR